MPHAHAVDARLLLPAAVLRCRFHGTLDTQKMIFFTFSSTSVTYISILRPLQKFHATYAFACLKDAIKRY